MKLVACLLITLAVLCLSVHGADIEGLLSSMTLSEKVGQMTQIDISVFYDQNTKEINYPKLKEWIDTYQIGSVLNSIFSGGKIGDKVGWSAADWRIFINKMQTFASQTRLKIPILYGLDSIHGATYVYGSALFPHSLTVAASYNPALAKQAGMITAKDTRAAGIPWLFSPVLGLGLQPLWSRFEETFGEDPYLAAQMGSSMITGIQEPVNDGVSRIVTFCTLMSNHIFRAFHLGLRPV
jgi:beta-glucosidase